MSRRRRPSVLCPEGYHGDGARAPFFEGWYIKLVSADGRRSLAFIPGVFRGLEPGSEHAFVQIVDSESPRVRYERFSVDAFVGEPDRFAVSVAEHRFGDDGLEVAFDGCAGSVRFGALNPWPVTQSSPGAMGWYAWVPFMQCFHGVPSLDHGLEGRLEIGGVPVDFTGGRGYIEKDWGVSFPRRWVWMQSNHFAEQNLSVTASIADVPWLGGAFPGVLVGVWRGGRLRRFTTYTGARLDEVRVPDHEADAVEVDVVDATHRLTLRASGGRPMAIHCPTERDMRTMVHERLGATMEVRLLRRRDGAVELEGTGTQAAFEVQGDPRRLKRRVPFLGADEAPRLGRARRRPGWRSA